MIQEIIRFGIFVLLAASVYFLGFKRGELAALQWIDKTIDEVFEDVLQDIQKQTDNEKGNNRESKEV